MRTPRRQDSKTQKRDAGPRRPFLSLMVSPSLRPCSMLDRAVIRGHAQRWRDALCRVRPRQSVALQRQVRIRQPPDCQAEKNNPLNPVNPVKKRFFRAFRVFRGQKNCRQEADADVGVPRAQTSCSGVQCACNPAQPRVQPRFRVHCLSWKKRWLAVSDGSRTSF